MFLVRLLPASRMRSQRTLWQSFMNWLLEPIPFPGKTYHLDAIATKVDCESISPGDHSTPSKKVQ
jgi:hypothetical protein